jgi:hypothetical protein
MTQQLDRADPGGSQRRVAAPTSDTVAPAYTKVVSVMKHPVPE